LNVRYRNETVALSSNSYTTFPNLVASGLRRWPVILLIALPIYGLCATYATLAPVKYSAEASIVITGRPENLSQVAHEGDQSYLPREVVQTYVETVAAPSVLEAMVAQLPHETAEALLAQNSAPPEGKTETSDITDRRIQRIVHDQLSINQVGLASIIAVRFNASTPELAADIANLYVDTALAMARTRLLSADAGSAGNLNSAVEAIGERLRAERREAEEFRRREGLDGERSIAALELELGEVVKAIAEYRANAVQVESTLAQIAQGGAAYSSEVLASDLINNWKLELSREAGRLRDLSATYGARHPEVVGTTEKLADLESRIASEIDRIEAALEQEARASRSVEQTFGLERARLAEEISTARALQATSEMLTGMADATQKVYEDLLLSQTSRNVIEDSRLLLPGMRVLSMARPPINPSGLSEPILFAIATVLIFLCCLIVLVLSGQRGPEASNRGGQA